MIKTENKRYTDYGERYKFLFADDYLHRRSERINKNKALLDLINDYSKDGGYKVIIQKSMAFLYNSNEQVEF